MQGRKNAILLAEKSPIMSKEIHDFPIHHGGIQRVHHPRFDVDIDAQTAVRYMRFSQPVRIEHLELSPEVYGRWVPNVPTHPKHLIISALDPKKHTWTVVQEVDLPRNPMIAGEGLSQEMPVEEMEAHFAKVLEQPPYLIPLGGIETDHLRVECDREHPVWPSHGECNGGEFHVPFGILNSLKAFGKPLTEKLYEQKYLPTLKIGHVNPVAPEGMTVQRTPTMLLFKGEKLSVGFSLHRPMLLHLGWDFFARGFSEQNRLICTKANRTSETIGGLAGPALRTLTNDCLSHHWTGDVSVQGNQVTYNNLRCAVEGIRLGAVFTIHPDSIRLQFTQTCDREIPAIEYSAWRFAWDLKVAMTGAMGLPTLRPGRNGEIHLPFLWAGDGVGCLSCRFLEGDPVRMQIESYNSKSVLVGGVVPAPSPKSNAPEKIPQGTTETTIELAVTNLEPVNSSGGSSGILRSWSGVYSCFRPEYGGFSNQAMSVNCHVNQASSGEIITFTSKPELGPDPLDLYRFTIERALLDGGGYGYWRELYLDSDPILLSATGRIFQASPDRKWLKRIEPALKETLQRVFNTIGKEGLALCRTLSGNSGSYRWSSNAMDAVGFGHMDAYVNAWTYRGLRNAAAIMKALGNDDLSSQAREKAAAMKNVFAKYLLNPETGWVAGWRSRDGELHDYAFTLCNGPACAFGVLDLPEARKVMERLDQFRKKVAPHSGIIGIPFNLLPIDPADHMLPKIYHVMMPTFEMMTDGAMSPCSASYYLRALSITGLKDQAHELAKELDEGFAAGLWFGGNGSGVEFRCWDGVPSGYEGTFIASFAALYAIAIEQGLFNPPDPEWWPPMTSP